MEECWSNKQMSMEVTITPSTFFYVYRKWREKSWKNAAAGLLPLDSVTQAEKQSQLPH